MSVKEPDDLYALPLDEFTAARNRLAKETGDASVKASVKALRKPSKAAWALNQVARSHRGDVARFLHAAERVRAGGGRDALHDLRDAEADVRRAVQADADVRDVNALLAAAATDPAVGDRLRRGVLSGEEEAGELRLDAAPPSQDRVREQRERRAREKAREKREKAEAAYKEADAEADRLEREADEAEEQAARLRSRAAKARDKADRLRAQLEELEALEALDQ